MGISDLDELKDITSLTRYMEYVISGWMLLPQIEGVRESERESHGIPPFQPMFSNLSCVAVSALLERQPDRWYYHSDVQRLQDLRLAGAKCFSGFINAHPMISSVCLIEVGPISFLHDLIKDRIAPTSLNFHSAEGEFEHQLNDIRVPAGVSTRWYAHSWPLHSNYDADDIVFDLHHSFACLKGRTNSFFPASSKPYLDWGLYIGTRDGDFNLGKEEHILGIEVVVDGRKLWLAKAEKEDLGSGRDFRAVKWEIAGLTKAPCCQACGWKPILK